MQLQVKMSRLGGKVIELKKVYKSYGEKGDPGWIRLYIQKSERLELSDAMEQVKQPS
jgi:ATP-binding cassette subfamily F protein uup